MILNLSLLLLAGLWHGQPAFAASQTSGRHIHLETDRLVYEIGADGLNRAFRDCLGGKNFLANPSNFMSIEKDGRRVGSTAIEIEGENLRVKFGDSGVEAKVRIRAYPQYLTLRADLRQ